MRYSRTIFKTVKGESVFAKDGCKNCHGTGITGYHAGKAMQCRCLRIEQAAPAADASQESTATMDAKGREVLA
jgi:hypothetical protein